MHFPLTWKTVSQKALELATAEGFHSMQSYFGEDIDRIW